MWPRAVHWLWLLYCRGSLGIEKQQQQHLILILLGIDCSFMCCSFMGCHINKLSSGVPLDVFIKSTRLLEADDVLTSLFKERGKYHPYIPGFYINCVFGFF